MTEHRSTRPVTRARPRRRPRHSARVVRRRRQVALGVVLVMVLALVGVVVRVITAQGHGRQLVAALDAGSSTASTPASTPASVPASSRPTPTAMTVVKHGPGTFVTATGSVPAPGRGRVRTVRVQVETGTDVDVQQFAGEVMAILNDPRSWGHAGAMTFARTDGKADFTVVLASPDTSERMCRPLKTLGTESCNIGDKAILTSYRWAKATKEFPSLTVYREYVVNHEVGHVLGHHHEVCPGKGRPAPVMQQQTIKVAPCVANGWPFP